MHFWKATFITAAFFVGFVFGKDIALMLLTPSASAAAQTPAA